MEESNKLQKSVERQCENVRRVYSVWEEILLQLFSSSSFSHLFHVSHFIP